MPPHSSCRRTNPPLCGRVVSDFRQNLVSMLNEAKLATSTEVVIAPSSVHLHKALTSVRPDVAVSAQVSRAREES